MPEPIADFQRLRSLATTYRRLVLLVGLQLLLGALNNGLAAGAETATERVVIGLVVLAIALGMATILAVNGFRLAALLGLTAPVAWAVGMFVPLINIIVLLTLSSRAQATCRRHGVKVGFLGPHKKDLARLEKAASAGATR